MKYRIGSLAALLIIGLVSSASALAGPRNHQGDHGYRSSSQRSAPPARQARSAPPQQVRSAPPARQVRSAPPARQVRSAPPARQVRSAPPARQVHRAPPARQVHRAPPARQVHRAPPARQVHRAPPARHAHYAAPHRIVYTDSHHPGRSWRMGRSLPPRAVYHEVSAPYYSHYRLGPPPHNHRYVRVGDDILLIAIGTGLIAGAIYNISHY